MKKIFTLMLFAAFIGMEAKAQGDGGISDLFKGNKDDVNKLLNAYTDPLFKGFGNSLNGGWTNTAKTQKFLRFAIRVSASASIVPDADKTYDVNSLGLSYIKPTGSSIAQTFGGDKNLSTPVVVSDPNFPNDPTRKYNTSLPAGVVQYIPAPQIQLTVGLIKNTDITLRLIPTFQITSDVGSVGMFGLGLKHNFAPDLSKTLPFDLALAVGYTKLTYSKPLDVRKNDNIAIPGQTLDGNFTGWNTQVILSKKLLFFTPFVSLGYLSSNTNVGLHGTFPFVTGVTNTGQPTYTNYVDPISINGSNASTSGTRADIGFQMSLFFLKIYASYSFAAYQSANAGIGLGF
jgi:hypothetical protein